MSDMRIGVWAATGTTPGLLDIQNYLGNSIRMRFPPNFLNSYHFDTKTGFRSTYKNTRRNIVKNGQKSQFANQKRPRLTIIFDNKTNNQEEANGGIEQPFTYPLTQGVHPEMHGYIPFYADEYGIKMFYSHKRIRYSFSGLVEVDTLADQENVLVLLENILKVQYGSFLENVKSKIILPNDMINTIYRLRYFENIKRICSTDGDNDEKNVSLKILGARLEEDLKKYSESHAIETTRRNNKDDDKFFTYTIQYKKLYYEISNKPEKTDGEKLGSIYSKYTVTFDGFMEFERPIAYILTCPEIINGNLVSSILETTGDIDYFRDHNPLGYMKFFSKENDYPREVVDILTHNKNMKIIFKERDFNMESPTDTIDLIDWLISSKDVRTKKYGALMKVLSRDEFDEIFKIFLYDDTEKVPVDHRDIYWDGEILKIGCVDDTSNYRIFVLANVTIANYKISTILQRMEELKDEYEKSNR